jgi:hypothetical protein
MPKERSSDTALCNIGFKMTWDVKELILWITSNERYSLEEEWNNNY